MRARHLCAFLMLALSGCGESRVAQPTPPPATTTAPVEALPRVRPLDPPAAEGALALSPTAAGRDVVATWIEPADGDVHRVRFAVLNGATRAWSAPSTVIESAEVLPSSVDFPIPVRAAAGTYLATVLMRGHAEHASHVHLAASNDGLAWRVLGPVHDDGTDTEHGHASLFVERDAVRAVWLDGRAWVDGGPMALRTALIGGDGTIGASAVLDDRVCDCCQTAGAVAATGPVVAYRDRSHSEVRDIATVRRASEAWSAPSTVNEDGWTIHGCPVNGPQLAADGSHVALAWYSEGGGTPHVRVALSSDEGATFGAPIEIDPARALGRVDVEWASDDTALVVWLGADGEGGEVAVRARRVSRDGRLGEPIEIARTGATRATGVPRLAAVGDEMLVTWTDAGPPRRVRAAFVDPRELPAPTQAPTAPATRSAPRALAVGAALPPVALEDLHGAVVPLDSFRGRPIVVSFFAAWCAPCRDEFPLLLQLERAHGERLHVIGVSIDEGSVESVARFAHEHDLSYTILHDRDGAAARDFAVPPIPATFVFDARGTVVYRRSGGGPELLRELPEAVASAVRGAPAASSDGHAHEPHDHEH